MSGGRELWGATEAQAHLGVSRQRIGQLARAYPRLLPVVFRNPVTGKRWWLADDWRAFARIPRPAGRRVGTGGRTGLAEHPPETIRATDRFR